MKKNDIKILKHIADHLFLINSLFFLCFLFSCATEAPLTGGPEDLAQPELIYSVPRDMQTRFQTPKVHVVFDRYVIIANPQQNIIISPRPDVDPVFKPGLKSLSIQFQEKLRANTTYVLQFGESVTSFREPKVITQNLKLVFSTGREIDSASIQGTAYDAHQGKPLLGTMIGLYLKLADSIPRIEKPIYYTKTDSLGQYSIDNVARGKYQIFALLDENKNLMYDPPKEKLGFTIKNIEIKNNKDTLMDQDFWLFQEESTKQFVQETKHDQMGKIDFYFSQPFRENKVALITRPPLKYKAYWNTRRDSLRLWVDEIPEENAVKFIFSSKKWDSIPPVSVNLIRMKTRSYTDGEDNDLQLITKKFTTTENGPLLFEFSRPIQVVALDKIKILDKDSVRLQVEELTYKIDKKDPTLVAIYYPWKQDAYYSIELFRNAFIDAYNQTHPIFKSSFTVGKEVETQLASIRVTLDLDQISKKNKSPQYVLELVKSDKDLTVLDTKIVENSENFSFDNVKEGNYRIRIIMDKNKNGRWDTGNYETKTQPEHIYYYPEEIAIKANFTQEIEWIFSL